MQKGQILQNSAFLLFQISMQSATKNVKEHPAPEELSHAFDSPVTERFIIPQGQSRRQKDIAPELNIQRRITVSFVQYIGKRSGNIGYRDG